MRYIMRHIYCVTTWFFLAYPPKSEVQTLKMKRLSLKSKRKATSCLGDGRPKDLYKFKVDIPPGFTNPSSNCYANSMFQCLFSSPVFGEILQVLELSETQGNNGTIKTEIEYFKKYSYKNFITDHSNIGKSIFKGL